MKKLICTYIALMFIISISKAQTIPNAGFETWTTVNGYNVPSQWGYSSVFTTSKGTPGNPGSSYLKLTSKTVGPGVTNGIAVSGTIDSTTMIPTSGFAFGSRPQTFKGNWQHMIYGSTQGSINVTLTKWNTGTSSKDVIATATQTLSGMAMSWAPFIITFNYLSTDLPDTCLIVLMASGNVPTDQDYLWVDNLSFSGSVPATGIENSGPILTDFSVFPNPGSKKLTLAITASSSQKTTIELTDLNGKVILSQNSEIIQGETRHTMDIPGIAKGTYIIRVITPMGNESKKIVIE